MRPWSFTLFLATVLVACGSRTGLLVPGEGELEIPDSPTGPTSDDDDVIQGTADAGERPDGAEARDALPPIDVTVPVDAFNDCPDAGATLVYVVTEQKELLSFYPPAAQFRTIGPLDCPTVAGAPSPFSMAVDRTGIAYVLYSDGELFRVSTATARCQATGFRAGQSGFAANFGMGFSHDNVGTGETLFVASGGDTTAPSLATIDPQTFRLGVVGDLQPAITNAELSGTGAGDLFAFFATQGATPCDNMNNNPGCTDSAIGQLDKTTGRVVAQSVLRGDPQGIAWAFAFWGGEFYTFTAPTMSGTVVHRFNPADGSLVTLATRTDLIVGAGVSTCAPAE
jgi:hypothetical protein